MILDSQGQPIQNDTPVVDPIVTPEVPAVEPVVTPPVIEEVVPVVTPDPAPVVDPVVPAVDLGYPTEVAAEFKDLLKRFEDKGVAFDDVNLVLNDALESGDMSKLSDAALQSLVGDDAALIRLSLDGIIGNAKNQTNATMASLHEAAGGKEQFEAASKFLNEASEADRAMIEAGMKSDNKALQQLAVEKMMANFKQSPNYEQRAPQHPATNTPDGGGYENINVEATNSKDTFELLRAERKAGRWDGTDAGATPKVKEIRANALAYVREFHSVQAM